MHIIVQNSSTFKIFIKKPKTLIFTENGGGVERYAHRWLVHACMVWYGRVPVTSLSLSLPIHIIQCPRAQPIETLIGVRYRSSSHIRSVILPRTHTVRLTLVWGDLRRKDGGKVSSKTSFQGRGGKKGKDLYQQLVSQWRLQVTMSLVIVVDSGKSLPNIEKFGTIDPFVQLKFAGE